MLLLYVLPVLIGWFADLILGDPNTILHPVVIFGKIIGFFEKRLNKGGYKVFKGAVLAVSLIVLAAALFFAIVYFSDKVSLIFSIAVRSVFVYFFLAGTTLIREVRAVFKALDISLDAGRERVGRIVGRETGDLTEQEVKKAALETLAENLSDGVIAPLFWFIFGGLPVMATYKMINTLDSMIGYKTERYKQFGMVAAKIDDVANWIPARLTAFLMIVLNGRLKLFGFVRKFARCHASPNSGYPESALAAILNCRFGGPHTYFGEIIEKPYIGDNDKILTNNDLKKSVSINRVSEVVMVILTIVSGAALRYFIFR